MAYNLTFKNGGWNMEGYDESRYEYEISRECTRYKNRYSKPIGDCNVSYNVSSYGSIPCHSASMGRIMDAYNESKCNEYWG